LHQHPPCPDRGYFCGRGFSVCVAMLTKLLIVLGMFAVMRFAFANLR
jgi:hypothetical protein